MFEEGQVGQHSWRMGLLGASERLCAEDASGDKERSRPIMLGGQSGHGEPATVFQQEVTPSGAEVAESSPLPVFVTVVSLAHLPIYILSKVALVLK